MSVLRVCSGTLECPLSFTRSMSASRCATSELIPMVKMVLAKAPLLKLSMELALVKRESSVASLRRKFTFLGRELVRIVISSA